MAETTTKYTVVCRCGYESVFLLPPTIVRCAQCGNIINVQAEASKATAQQEGE